MAATEATLKYKDDRMRHICFSLIQQMDVLIQNGLYENYEPDDSEPGSESEDAPDVAQDCHRQCE